MKAYHLFFAVVVPIVSGCSSFHSGYEDYDFEVVRRGEAIESVAGFKFGSEPPVRGQKDVCMRLDPPVRDFTHIHLGFVSDKLHTVTFLTDPSKYDATTRYEPAFSRELDILRPVCESGWKTNNVGFFAEDHALEGRVDFRWNTKESGIFIFGPLKKDDVGFSQPRDAMAVCFVNWSVNGF